MKKSKFLNMKYSKILNYLQRKNTEYFIKGKFFKFWYQ